MTATNKGDTQKTGGRKAKHLALDPQILLMLRSCKHKTQANASMKSASYHANIWGNLFCNSPLALCTCGGSGQREGFLPDNTCTARGKDFSGRRHARAMRASRLFLDCLAESNGCHFQANESNMSNLGQALDVNMLVNYLLL